MNQLSLDAFPSSPLRAKLGSQKTSKNVAEETLALLDRHGVEFYGRASLETKLKAQKSLVCKAGFDPTSPDLHLGHSVLLKLLRKLSDLGHQVVFVVGDYTARIGDPSGRNKTRPPLDALDIEKNAQTYAEQAFVFLDQDKTTLLPNAQWLEALSFSEVILLSATQTVAGILEREDFKNRYTQGVGIGLHEFYYPIMQGYDSVAMGADLEFGGTDQTFNLLVGRNLQKSFGMSMQAVVTMPLLEGLDGVRKMSKSYNNYIGVFDTPKDVYGKSMSIPDSLIQTYHALVLDLDAVALKALQTRLDAGENPRDIKKLMAHSITAMLHGESKADEAQAEFARRFQKRDFSADDLPLQTISLEGKPPTIISALLALGFASSGSEATRLVNQGGVRIDGQKVGDRFHPIASGQEYQIKAGKLKLAKVRFEF